MPLRHFTYLDLFHDRGSETLQLFKEDFISLFDLWIT